MDESQQYLNGLKRVVNVEENEDEEVLLLPSNIEITIDKESMVKVKGLSSRLDSFQRDLLRIIEIENAMKLQYKETNVLSPLVYVHNLTCKPWHITTQGLLITNLSKKTIEWIKEENRKVKYAKHEFDCFWLPFSKKIDFLDENDLVCVFNRRIRGWDGSPEKPVIELLGAGGHLPSVWDKKKKKFKALGYKENLKKEFREEIGLIIKDEDIEIMGGFVNENSHELVILCGVYVDEKKIPQMHQFSLNNKDEDNEGLYLGTFDEVIKYYKKNPEPFAGGKAAAPYNFPNNNKLMKKIKEYYERK